MDGDVTITGDLTVSGGIGLSLSEVIQGTSTIDVTNTEAFLVRKNSDGGDIFTVDTTNEDVAIGGTRISSEGANQRLKFSFLSKPDNSVNETVLCRYFFLSFFFIFLTAFFAVLGAL